MRGLNERVSLDGRLWWYDKRLCRECKDGRLNVSVRCEVICQGMIWKVGCESTMRW